ncbi:MAG TPA: outer membrane protein transport protein [Tepidisphaeraceae bacterium]|nr:outer membrane protein transport protein [Tepidisphaeraceae bacterium]
MRKFGGFRLTSLTLALLCALEHSAHGGAIDVPMQSSKAAGQADAFTAQADDPSAIFYNPAGLTQLHGSQISAGAYYLQPIFHFQGDNGDNERMNLPTVLPHLYVESDFGFDRWRFGLGVNDVYGINEDWGNQGPLRTLVNKAQLSVINIAPTVAFRVDSRLSIGIAFNVYYGSLNLERNVVLAAPPAPEGSFRLHGNDFAFGVTPAVMYKIDERNQIGAYYRSPFTLDFNGKAQITSALIPEIGPSHARTTLNLPQSVGLGYAMKPVKPLTLEADVIWTDWHAVNQLSIQSPDAHFNGQTLPAHWESGFTIRGGIQYQLTQHWIVRGGYAYGQNSVPESTFSPLVPDSNYHLFALGLGYDTNRWNLDLAYDFIYREQRHIANSVNSPTVNGTWDNQFHGLMLTLTVKL